MESGGVNAPSWGVLWIGGPRKTWIFSRDVERLQRDSWGAFKLRKDDLPAKRCVACKLVLFEYTAGD